MRLHLRKDETGFYVTITVLFACMCVEILTHDYISALCCLIWIGISFRLLHYKRFCDELFRMVKKWHHLVDEIIDRNVTMYLHDTTEAKAERREHPSSGACGICGRPWAVVKHHHIDVGNGRGVFAQCEECWRHASDSDIILANSITYHWWLNEGSTVEKIGFTEEHLMDCTKKALEERKKGGEVS